MNMVRSFVLSCGVVASLATSLFAQAPFSFEDVTAKTGLEAILEKMPGKRPWRYAHGAGWGDANGDGRPDLFVGAFAARKWFEGEDAPTPNFLLLNTQAGFVQADAAVLEAREGKARCAGVLWADLDGDGDSDLVVMNHAQTSAHDGSKLYENQGEGRFRDVTPKTSPWTDGLGMRNASVIDYDRDGRLDLMLADGSYGKANEAKARLLVLHNEGNWKFTESSAAIGLPQSETMGLGLALGDANNDGRLDIFVAGSQRLFVSTNDGKFREAHRERFAFKPADVPEGVHCGAAMVDLNADGWTDLVTTEHGVPTRLHVFRNRGEAGLVDGVPDFEEVSERSGVGNLFPKGTRKEPLKTAHVALQDMDFDGRPDLVLTVIYKDAEGRIQPVVLRNLSELRGDIRFTPPPLDKMVGYYAPGPLGDYDQDGRLDIFLASWFEHLPNYLFRNTTDVGHSVSVRVRGKGAGFNTMGIGARVSAFAPADGNKPERLISQRIISVGNGYASCEEPIAYLAVGEALKCKLRVEFNGEIVEQDADSDSAVQIIVEKK